jgi:hypothetical protein
MLRCGLALAAVLSVAAWRAPAAANTSAHLSGSTSASPIAVRARRQGASRTFMKRQTLPIPPLPIRKSEATQPDVWSASEIEAAQARCTAILKSIDAVAVPQPPIKEGKCGTPAPIRLISLGTRERVTFEPAALVNCEMAGALNEWINKDLQPLARKHLGARIVKVEIMGDYSCRASTGRIGHRLSEHAFADALDIGGFVTEKGHTVRVLNEWGETERDIAAQTDAAKIDTATADAKVAAAAPAKAGDSQRLAIVLPVSRKAAIGALRLAPTRLGGLTAAQRAHKDHNGRLAALSPPVPPAVRAAPMKNEQQFLHAAHDSACRIFATTLGPEANEAHRNHFHVDMATRKYKKICDKP